MDGFQRFQSTYLKISTSRTHPYTNLKGTGHCLMTVFTATADHEHLCGPRLRSRANSRPLCKPLPRRARSINFRVFLSHTQRLRSVVAKHCRAQCLSIRSQALLLTLSLTLASLTSSLIRIAKVFARAGSERASTISPMPTVPLWQRE